MLPTLREEMLRKLRAQVGAVDGSDKLMVREFSRLKLQGGGLPRGCLVDVSGFGKTQWVVDFLLEHPHLRVFWLAEDLQVHPQALSQRGLDLQRVYFCQAGADFLWVLQKVLPHSVWDVVVTESSRWEERALRRGQLLAEKSSVHWIRLLTEPSSSSVPKFQVHLEEGQPVLFRRRGAWA